MQLGMNVRKITEILSARIHQQQTAGVNDDISVLRGGVVNNCSVRTETAYHINMHNFKSKKWFSDLIAELNHQTNLTKFFSNLIKSMNLSSV